MDYAFREDSRVAYQAGEPFVEILCLDSVNALHCERNQDAAAIRSGVYIYFHRAEQGELRFFAGTPIRGLRIVIKDRFFNERPFRGSIRSGMERELYYESKIAELLCVFAESFKNTYGITPQIYRRNLHG
jgi:hypothetical protein